MLNSLKAGEMASMKGGEDTVAWVKKELCIGCDQCTIVCDDDAIELYDKPLSSPILNIDVNKKARVLRGSVYWLQTLCSSMPDRCNNNDR